MTDIFNKYKKSTLEPNKDMFASFKQGSILNNNHYTLFVRNDCKPRKFYSFINIDSFNKYISTLPKEQYCFNELVRTNDYRWEFYDIELELSKHDDLETLEGISSYTLYIEWENCREHLEYHYGHTFSSKDTIVLESNKYDSNNKLIKISLHIICKSVCFKNLDIQKRFMKQFNEMIDDVKPLFLSRKHVFDIAVYKRNTSLRMENMTKYNQNRYLKRVSYPYRTFSDSDSFITQNIDKSKEWIFDENIIKKEVEAIEREREERLKAIKEYKDNEQDDEAQLIDILTSYLSKLDPDLYSDWNKACFVVKSNLPTMSGFKLFSEWAINDDYGEEIQVDKWDKCHEGERFIFPNSSMKKKDCDDCSKLDVGTILHKSKLERTKEEKEFLHKNIQQWTERTIQYLTETEKGIEKTDNYVNKDIFENAKCIVVKAGLGKGKTYSVTEHLNKVRPIEYHQIVTKAQPFLHYTEAIHCIPQPFYYQIVVLTPRRTFAKSVHNRLNKTTPYKFVHYSSIKEKSIRYPYIVIQAESLHRLNASYYGKDTLVLIDEVESFLFQLNSKYHKENISINLLKFECLLKMAKKVICLDAFISPRTLQTLKSLNIDYRYYNYVKPLEQRTAIRYNKAKDLLNKLISSLNEGKKIFFFCSSNRKLVDYFLPTIKQQCPGKNIIEYHSKRCSIDLTTINENWKNADLIVCTSTITVGCNFDLPGIIDSLFCYANSNSRNLTRDIFQALYRVRHPISKTLHFCIDTRHNGINLSCSMTEIRKNLKTKVELITDQYNRLTKNDWDGEPTSDWIRDLIIFNTLEHNVSIMQLEAMFNHYLTECNYTLKTNEEELEDMFDENEIEIIKFEYDDIRELTFTEFQQLEQRKIIQPLNEMETAQMEKYFFHSYLVTNRLHRGDVKGLWDLYRDFGKGKFRNICYEKGIRQQTFDIVKLISPVQPELASNFSLRCELIQRITDLLGVEHSHDFTTEISRLELENKVGLLEKERETLLTAFNLRDRRKPTNKFTLRHAVDLINKILCKHGYSKLKSTKQQRVRINGKRVDITPFQLVNTTKTNLNVYDNIKGKGKGK